MAQTGGGERTGEATRASPATTSGMGGPFDKAYTELAEWAQGRRPDMRALLLHNALAWRYCAFRADLRLFKITQLSDAGWVARLDNGHRRNFLVTAQLH